MFAERTVSDEELLQYAPLVERMAWKYSGLRGVVEFDDLYQEGMFAVWQDLRYYNNPSENIVKQAMRNWSRFMTREGMGGYDEPHVEL